MANADTAQLQQCLDRLRAGDANARDTLLENACERLRRLTRKMLHDYRGVHRWEETADVQQNAMLRLCRALNAVTPLTLRDFFRLAAAQVCRELIDLARHYYGPQGMGAHHASQAPDGDASHAPPPAYDAADSTGDPRRMAQWTEFHSQVERLSDDEREAFDLIWYQGLTQLEAANVIGVSDRTGKSRWRSARLKLYDALGGELPDG